MEKDEFLRKLCDKHKGLAKGKFADYDKDIVDMYKSLLDSGELTVFHGLICVVGDKLGENQYALVPYTGSYQELQADPSFAEYHYWRAVAKKNECHVCGKTYFVSGDEDTCPYCNNQEGEKC